MILPAIDRREAITLAAATVAVVIWSSAFAGSRTASRHSRRPSFRCCDS